MADQQDTPPGRGGLDVVMGILFLGVGIVFLMIPSTDARRPMMVVLGLVNIAAGIIKLARGLRG